MNKKLLFTSIALIISVLTSGFLSTKEPKRIEIPISRQRSGDPDKGFQYLINGDYVSSGIPYNLASVFMPKDSSNVLNREGDSAFVSPTFNLVKHANGTRILAPNCLTCHSDKINGEFIVGLGNNSFDYTINTQGLTTMLDQFIKNRYSVESKEYESFEQFKMASDALSNKIKTKVRGVNPADKLTAVLVAHRNPVSLEWIKKSKLELPKETIPTDVPAWWLLKKKNAMFSTGIGRGDFSRFLMASSLLTFKDTTEAAEIDRHFPDVLAWINTLESPKYPRSIDEELALKGRKLFDLNCSTCHGTYGDNEKYPNLLISLEEVGTDPALSNAYTGGMYADFLEWYDKSWFTTGSTPGKVKVEGGYIAPPLDGVWATAPYLHNGSVPTIDVLLNSKSRPEYWARSFNSNDYDMVNIGWLYEALDTTQNSKTYDTTISGYSNTGHTFGDDLEDSERMAVIEYLKTL